MEIREIDQFSLTGKLIKTFKSISEASKKTGVDLTTIFRVCKGQCKTAGNFIWKYNNTKQQIEPKNELFFANHINSDIPVTLFLNINELLEEDKDDLFLTSLSINL